MPPVRRTRGCWRRTPSALLDAIAAVVAPTVRYVIHGGARLSGTYEGVEGMLAWMRLAGEISECTVRFVPESVATEVRADS